MTTPFKLPSKIASEFASAESFRGRPVLIEVTGFEKDVPNPLTPGKFADRVTATVTVVDGKGPVQIFAQKVPTGVFMDGPVHKGVWFSQDRIVKAVADKGAASIGEVTLGIIETYKPGKAAGLGNPWGILDPTEAQIAQATEFLAKHMVGQATGNTGVEDDEDDPFAVKN
jgi:hypothetical protein